MFDMDITGVITQGIISGLFSVGIGLIGAYLGFRYLESRVKEAFRAEILSEVTGFMKALHDNPESFAPVVNGFITDISRLFPAGKGVPMLEGIPAEGIGALLPFVPKKWRGLVAIAQMFAGNKDTTAKPGEGKSPFG